MLHDYITNIKNETMTTETKEHLNARVDISEDVETSAGHLDEMFKNYLQEHLKARQ